MNAAIKNVEDAIKKKALKLPSKVRNPMDGAFVPEIDGTPELDS